MENNIIKTLKGLVKPDIELFKIGPEVITDFIGKFIIVIGGRPDDIRTITIDDDKKKLKVVVSIDRDSDLFRQSTKNNFESTINLTFLKGSEEPKSKVGFSEDAKNVLRSLGFIYTDERKRIEKYLFNLEKGKKSIDMEFTDPELLMAIITNSNYTDEYLFVDASEEVISKKEYDKKKFKGKKSCVTFAKVQRTFNNSGFDPKQVYDRFNYPVNDNSDD